MIIGKTMRPHVFNKNIGLGLWFGYRTNEKAFMNGPILFQWINRFNRYVAQSIPGRKVLLLNDNWFAHGSKNNPPQLSNVSVLSASECNE